MRSNLTRAAAVLVAAALAALPSGATSLIPMSLEQVSNQAGAILEGRVVDLQTYTTGSSIPENGREVMPAAPLTDDSDTPPSEVQAPTPLGVEGGQMIHTRVTFRVDRAIAGRADKTVTFTVAGGTHEGESAIVLGMPVFEVGERYVVFLRPDFKDTGVPLVGVSQGFFHLEERQPGQPPTILDGNGDVLVAVEDGQVVVQRDRERPQRPLLELGPVPTPGPGSDARAGRDPEVGRYQRAGDPPLPPERFYAEIQRLREVR